MLGLEVDIQQEGADLAGFVLADPVIGRVLRKILHPVEVFSGGKLTQPAPPVCSAKLAGQAQNERLFSR